MAEFGSFDSELNRKALFDDTVLSLGWYAPDLIDEFILTGQIVLLSSLATGIGTATSFLNVPVFTEPPQVFVALSPYTEDRIAAVTAHVNDLVLRMSTLLSRKEMVNTFSAQAEETKIMNQKVNSLISQAKALGVK